MVSIQIDGNFLKGFDDKNGQGIREYVQKEADKMIIEQFRDIPLTDTQTDNLRGVLKRRILCKLFERLASDMLEKMSK